MSFIRSAVGHHVGELLAIKGSSHQNETQPPFGMVGLIVRLRIQVPTHIQTTNAIGPFVVRRLPYFDGCDAFSHPSFELFGLQDFVKVFFFSL